MTGNPKEQTLLQVLNDWIDRGYESPCVLTKDQWIRVLVAAKRPLIVPVASTVTVQGPRLRSILNETTSPLDLS